MAKMNKSINEMKQKCSRNCVKQREQSAIYSEQNAAFLLTACTHPDMTYWLGVQHQLLPYSLVLGTTYSRTYLLLIAHTITLSDGKERVLVFGREIG